MRRRILFVFLACTVGALSAIVVSAARAGASGSTTSTGTAAAGTFVPVPAVNVLDTTTGVGGQKFPVAPHGTTLIALNGFHGVPSDATAVALDVVVVSPQADGFVTVYPYGHSRPGTSNIDFTRHQRIADLVIVQAGTLPSGNGAATVYNGSYGATNIVANVVGYYAGGGAPVAGGYQPVFPANVLDTGTGVGAPKGLVPAHGTVSVQLTGRGGIPSSNVSAVALEVAFVAPTHSGFGTVYPADQSRPGTSNIDFVAPQTIANVVITGMSPTGAVDIYNGSGGTVRIEANVYGYYVGGSPSGAGTLQPIPPANLLDTGTGVGTTAGPVAAHATVTFTVTGRGGVPSTNVQAVVLNVAVVLPVDGGYAVVYPSDATRPLAATMDFTPGRTVANLTITPVSATGTVSIYNGSSSTVRFVANVTGYTLNS